MEAITLQQIIPFLPHQLNIECLDYKIDYVGLRYDILAGVNQWSACGKLWSLKTNGGSKPSLDRIKPLLHPISSITKPIIHNGLEIVPIVELGKISVPESYHYPTRKKGIINGEECIKGFSLTFSEGSFILTSKKGQIDHSVKNQLQLFQKLAEWHINFLNIPDHLFIDKSTVKI